MQDMKMEATSKQISTWKQVCDRLPTNIFVFIRRALNNYLITQIYIDGAK